MITTAPDPEVLPVHDGESTESTWQRLNRIRKERAAAREERFHNRQARLDADPDIDPRRRALWLDRTLVNSEQTAQILGISLNRVYFLRKEGRLIEIDVSNDAGSCVELGRLREWAERESHYVMDLETGRLVKGRIRHGRTRHDRSSLTRQRHPQDDE